MGWRTLSSRSVIRDRSIDLRADRRLTPSGVEIDPYDVLDDPDPVRVVAPTSRRDLVLVRWFRHGAGQEVPERPAGGVEPADADPQAAARRELAEEAGFVFGRWLHAARLHADPATQTNRVHAVLALDAAAQHRQRLDAGEEGPGVTTLPFDDVLARLGGGLIGQAVQVSFLLLAEGLMVA